MDPYFRDKPKLLFPLSGNQCAEVTVMQRDKEAASVSVCTQLGLENLLCQQRSQHCGHWVTEVFATAKPVLTSQMEPTPWVSQITPQQEGESTAVCF